MKKHAIFLKYCPSKRDRCYHAIANDTSNARPHELLNLKIKDVKFKLSSTIDGMQYAEVHISKSKTKPKPPPHIFNPLCQGLDRFTPLSQIVIQMLSFSYL